MKKTSKPAPVGDPARRHAVIYARVSSKEQEKEGFSIPAQLKLLEEYAAANGFTVAQEYVDVETAKQAALPSARWSPIVTDCLSPWVRRSRRADARLITVSRPDSQGLGHGLILTLSNPRGMHFTPASTPVVIKRIGEQIPHLGFVHSRAPDYGLYKAQLLNVLIGQPPVTD